MYFRCGTLSVTGAVELAVARLPFHNLLRSPVYGPLSPRVPFLGCDFRTSTSSLALLCSQLSSSTLRHPSAFRTFVLVLYSQTD